MLAAPQNTYYASQLPSLTYVRTGQYCCLATSSKAHWAAGALHLFLSASVGYARLILHVCCGY